ncbi:hypothetical protein CHUAL_008469 [Chamberlinius hualienensis]
MASSMIVLVVCCLATLAISSPLPGGYGGGSSDIYRNDHGYDSYDFGYNVNEPHTGDYHGRQESRNGYNVHGNYHVGPNYGAPARTVKYADNGYGVRQTVIGSEHGLYVQSPDVTIVPGHKY